jgi:MHS family proline/betaine transporter-like MFS transporter
MPIPPSPEQHLTRFKLIAAASLVTGLEIFDFTVFSFFAAMIGDQFFPAKNPMTSLLLAVGTFGVGFFMRPLGALLIGAYADRAGRRAAMLLTIWLMSLGTALIALAPPFAVIGMAAPLLIVLGRLLQGAATGGEIGAASSLMMEVSPRASRAYLVSWQLASQGAGILCGAASGVLLASCLSRSDLAAWGWRLPFLFGLLLAPVGSYVRRRLPEVRHAAPASTPLKTLYREHGKTIVLATLIKSWSTVPAYAVVFYMPSYLTRVMHMPAITGFWASSLSAALLMVLAPLSGRIADRLPRRKPLLLVMASLTTLLLWPVFLMVSHAHSVLPILLGVSLVSIPVALGAGAGAVLVLEALPPAVRASGFAIQYALGVALFGGTAQFIVTALIQWSGDPVSAVWYVVPASAVSVVALMLFEERQAEDV